VLLLQSKDETEMFLVVSVADSVISS
jgi:hypothetical protein